MIDFFEARRLILENTPKASRTETVPLGEAVGRVLAAKVSSDVDLPPFDKSGMDGFAVRFEDLERSPATLRVVMDIPAGASPDGALGPREAAAIMTGAALPEGADTVVQVEHTSGFGKETVDIIELPSRGANVSPKGEILAKGAAVLEAGTYLDVEEVSLLASVGVDPVTVYVLPSVAVVSTGDEIVPPSETPGPFAIRDVNGPALAAFVRSLGIEPVLLPPAKDDKEALTAAVERGLEHDCLLMSGGVSAGEYDFVEDVLAQLGLEAHTRRVAVKPGKPTVFATKGEKMVFGLPGNPVSATVIAHLLVEPALRKRMGRKDFEYETISAKLEKDIRKKANRAWFIHGVLSADGTSVAPLKAKGSADLVTAAKGNCLIFGAQGETAIPAGTSVNVVVWERARGR